MVLECKNSLLLLLVQTQGFSCEKEDCDDVAVEQAQLKPGNFHMRLSLLKAAFTWPIRVIISLNVDTIFSTILPRCLHSTIWSIFSFPHLIWSKESVVAIVLVLLVFILRQSLLAFLLILFRSSCRRCSLDYSIVMSFTKSRSPTVTSAESLIPSVPKLRENEVEWSQKVIATAHNLVWRPIEFESIEFGLWVPWCIIRWIWRCNFH